MDFEKSILIMAHPDDEVIFTSSIIRKVKKIIICFGESFDDHEVSKGRRSLYKEYPFKNTIFLKIKESPRQKRTYVPFLNPLETEYGIKKGSCNEKLYTDNFKILVFNLRKYFSDNLNIITHNPWGEYGHPEHVQVHRSVMKIAKDYDCNVYVNSYFSDLSARLMYKTINRISNEYLCFSIEDNLFQEMKNLYIRNNCWTWYENYKNSDIELFFLMNKKSKFDWHSGFNTTNNKVSKLPLNFIDMRRPSILRMIYDLLFFDYLKKYLFKKKFLQMIKVFIKRIV